MTIMVLVVAVVVLLMLATALVIVWGTDAALGALVVHCGESRERARQLRAEAAAALAAEQAELAAEMADVVDAGTIGARDVHRAIADIPFGVLDSMAATRAASGRVREVHDRTADGVYGAISAVNKAADGLFKALRRRRDP